MRIEMTTLAWLGPRQHANDLAFAVDLQNAAHDCIAHVNKMIGCNAETKRVPEFPFAEETSITIEDLYARILTITDVNEIAVDCDRVWKIELSGSRSFHSPPEQHVAVLVELQDSRVAFTIGDIEISIAIEGNVGRLIEVENIISRHSHSTQSQQNAPLGAELKDHVCADIRRPDFVLSIHPHCMRCDK